ncbi:MAG: TetR/AcrR family transcriptional regulator [Candidatus Sericytochromatia bacterium]
MSNRSYDSPLRAEQAEKTREKILAALFEQLSESRDDFSISRVAKRAGVSVRTVYHYFPNREAQIEGLADWIDRQFVPEDEQFPESFAELPAYSACRTKGFKKEHLDLVHVTLESGLTQKVRSTRRRIREQKIEDCVVAEGLPPESTTILTEMLNFSIGASLGVGLHDTVGLNVDQSVSAMNWLVKIMVKASQEGNYPRLD